MPSIFIAQGRSDRRQTWEGLDVWGIGVRLRENAGRGAARESYQIIVMGFKFCFDSSWLRYDQPMVALIDT